MNAVHCRTILSPCQVITAHDIVSLISITIISYFCKKCYIFKLLISKFPSRLQYS